jgi:hypothetical protein
MSIGGGLIKGIYHRACPWETSEVEDRYKVPFLNALQVYKEVDGVMVGTTHLYDKRRDRVYHGLAYVQYTHATSNLSKDCLYNIVTGQGCRFSRIIMDRDNIKDEVKILLEKLVSQGYIVKPLLKRYKRFVSLTGLFCMVEWVGIICIRVSMLL